MATHYISIVFDTDGILNTPTSATSYIYMLGQNGFVASGTNGTAELQTININSGDVIIWTPASFNGTPVILNTLTGNAVTSNNLINLTPDEENGSYSVTASAASVNAQYSFTFYIGENEQTLQSWDPFITITA